MKLENLIMKKHFPRDCSYWHIQLNDEFDEEYKINHSHISIRVRLYTTVVKLSIEVLQLYSNPTTLSKVIVYGTTYHYMNLKLSDNNTLICTYHSGYVVMSLTRQPPNVSPCHVLAVTSRRQNGNNNGTRYNDVLSVSKTPNLAFVGVPGTNDGVRLTFVW